MTYNVLSATLSLYTTATTIPDILLRQFFFLLFYAVVDFEVVLLL